MATRGLSEPPDVPAIGYHASLVYLREGPFFSLLVERRG
jgi:hypothetical protein